jgi:methionyl-tRNA synthetase
MIEKYFEGKVPAPQAEAADEVEEAGRAFAARYAARMEKMAFHEAQESVLELARTANRYIDGRAPWKMAKDPKRAGDLARCLYNLAETLRLAAYALIPFMPSTAPRMLEQLGLQAESKIGPKGELPGLKLDQALQWGGLQPGTRVNKGQPLFPREDVAGKKEK